MDKMSEEPRRYWKEEWITRYAMLENQIVSEAHLMDADPELKALTQERALINKKIEYANKEYLENIEEAKQEQMEIKSKLVHDWDIEDKTFKCPTGTATLRTTRVLRIYDKKRLIEFLMLIKKLPEYIKSFETVQLRKVKEAGLLEDSIANWDETKGIVIKLTEEKQ